MRTTWESPIRQWRSYQGNKSYSDRGDDRQDRGDNGERFMQVWLLRRRTFMLVWLLRRWRHWNTLIEQYRLLFQYQVIRPGLVKNYTIKQLSLPSTKTNSVTLPPHIDFIILKSGDFIVIDFKDQVIRRVMSAWKASDIVRTKPVHHTLISKTQTNEILLSLKDGRDLYKLQPSSRRLVQRMTLTGKILNTYEFQEDGVTRLFIFPRRATENGNSDIDLRYQPYECWHGRDDRASRRRTVAGYISWTGGIKVWSKRCSVRFKKENNRIKL